MTWPGFVAEPCADCGHYGHNHQPSCMTVLGDGDDRRHCLCPAYRATEPQQVGLFTEPSGLVTR
ncbi:hypothetical protein [Mycolicibacterium mucogenicum]|uniref:hypothetical protein n=1 Tax=Mycolicibacterium mucogenicum TaxID=56689 RepID=UPI00076A2184|nr:hypothetical protein [Mycolicibacterium mucogenicum]